MIASIWRPSLAVAVVLCGGDRMMAEDAVQNAFIQCLRRIRTLRDPAKFEPWFLRILTRASSRLARRRSASHEAPGLDEAFVANDDQGIFFLRLCLAELDAPLREALLLTAVAGYTSDEVAAILGVRPGTVRYRTHLARAQLQKILRPSQTNLAADSLARCIADG
jgi:RNA polymerase sigma-70 factor (ECF subfamily)